MPLTKITSSITDIVDISTSLKLNTDSSGIRNYIDTQILTTSSTINGTITTEVGDLQSQITNITTSLLPTKGDMFKSDNLAGLSDVSVAKSNLGLVFGTTNDSLSTIAQLKRSNDTTLFAEKLVSGFTLKYQDSQTISVSAGSAYFVEVGTWESFSAWALYGYLEPGILLNTKHVTNINLQRSKKLIGPFAARTTSGSTNGLISGSAAANTCYHVYAIATKRTDSVTGLEIADKIDFVFYPADNVNSLVTNSTWLIQCSMVTMIDKCTLGNVPFSNSGFGLPSGYTHYKRIGSIFTDSSGAIIPFVQIGDEFFVNPGPLATTAESLYDYPVDTPPPGYKCHRTVPKATCKVNIRVGAGAPFLLQHGYYRYTKYTPSPISTANGAGGDSTGNFEYSVITNTRGEFRYTGAIGSQYFQVMSYTDLDRAYSSHGQPLISTAPGLEI